MEKEFIVYEQALELKDLGFDEPCFATYFTKDAWQIDCQEGVLNFNNKKPSEYTILAPTWRQAFRFFREKYDLQCWPEVTGSNRYSCRYDGNDETGKRWVGYLKDYNGQSVLYSKYEEAELVCLKELIEIVKKQIRHGIRS